MKHNRYPIKRAGWPAIVPATLLVACVALGGCVMPAGDYGGYGGGGGYGGQGGHQQSEPPQPQMINVNGDWRFGDNVNRMQATYDGMLVTPVGRGKAVPYVEIGPNLYQDANSTGTYEFLSANHAIWRSNNARNQVIHLYR